MTKFIGLVIMGLTLALVSGCGFCFEGRRACDKPRRCDCCSKCPCSTLKTVDGKPTGSTGCCGESN